MGGAEAGTPLITFTNFRAALDRKSWINQTRRHQKAQFGGIGDGHCRPGTLGLSYCSCRAFLSWLSLLLSLSQWQKWMGGAEAGTPLSTFTNFQAALDRKSWINHTRRHQEAPFGGIGDGHSRPGSLGLSYCSCTFKFLNISWLDKLKA